MQAPTQSCPCVHAQKTDTSPQVQAKNTLHTCRCSRRCGDPAGMARSAGSIPPALIDVLIQAQADGRRATTHWIAREIFTQKFRHVHAETNALFVDEGRVLTSAGMAARLDCCLHLLARLKGPSYANQIARALVVAPQRGSQRPQLIKRPVIYGSTDARLDQILEGLAHDPTQSPSLDSHAAQMHMSHRSLTRHIHARTGTSLGRWMRAPRVARAQDMLSSGPQALAIIANACGFADPSPLRNAFRAELGLTPTQWMARYRSG